MAKLFQTELEHYEKLEGMQLSCEGKANKLGQMVKANLPMVFQGLVVMPLYVGYDLKRSEGRIFKYDGRRALRRVGLSRDRVRRKGCPQHDARAFQEGHDRARGPETCPLGPL